MPSKETSANPGVVSFNDDVKGTEQLLRQRYREKEGWRRGDKEQGNGVHPRALNKGKLHCPGGVLPTELGGLPSLREGEKSVFNSCLPVINNESPMSPRRRERIVFYSCVLLNKLID